MGWLAAALFRRVQAAGFYEDLHRRAVALLPPGADGAAWLDVGCGPGLLARLAVVRGYTVTAVDRDPAMIAAAALHPANDALIRLRRLRFRTAALEDLTGWDPVSVVSAGSLLAVVPDRAAALRQLLARLAPGGQLLLVEPSARMTLRHALRWLVQSGGGAGGGGWLLLWAATRTPARVVDRAGLDRILSAMAGTWRLEAVPLLDGMVTAWVISAA
ncbi:class I SAM-dependent methyltransferase [Novispirillum itersonii]|uniref:SAM-dependent methyltransferase n=1 Tax=Novispirillum itersonii TaxID=189 RepID=A0A7W9ZF27_NOVIT|nr:methyltransferase domain-containing protein [Novispirillum itersonii]MBB6210308.1 SAM-dependent methyltransferase [Novispirillum itersonii]